LSRRCSKPALGPHKTNDVVGQRIEFPPSHGPNEQIGLTIRCMVRHDLVRRNQNPRVIEPSVPAILRIAHVVIAQDPKPRLHDIARAATRKRKSVALWVLVIVRPLEAFKPALVRPIGPIAVSGTRGWARQDGQRSQIGRARKGALDMEHHY
jgi:hypothetical protein